MKSSPFTLYPFLGSATSVVFGPFDRRDGARAECHVLLVAAVGVFALQIVELIGPVVTIAQAAAKGVRVAAADALPLNFVDLQLKSSPT